MTTPFDRVVEAIKERGFHNHRKEEHSDLLSLGILKDLIATCAPLRADLESGAVKYWLNVPIPGKHERELDLLIGGARADDQKSPDLEKVRVCVENKSVVTAHRNRTSRYTDLSEVMKAVHAAREEAVLVATVLIGVALKVLNVPDRIKPTFKKNPKKFQTKILPRLSSGDARFWKEFPLAVSNNRPNDPKTTATKFRGLPTRKPGHTHVLGYDFVLLVPAFIDNVNPPYLARTNGLGIDIDADYQAMIGQICKAYTARWHL
jgi:hypothetical protein